MEKSVKQAICSSTMQVKFVACCEVIIPVVWLNFISGLRIVSSISDFVKIYCNNSLVVFYPRKHKRFSGSKHIVSKFLEVREKISEGHTVTEILVHKL